MAKTKTSPKVRPLGERILLQRIEPEEQTASGLYIPEAAQEKSQRATVLRVGEGRKLDNGNTAPFTVKEGDTVLLGRFGGTEITLDEQDLLITGEDDLLAVLG